MPVKRLMSDCSTCVDIVSAEKSSKSLSLIVSGTSSWLSPIVFMASYLPYSSKGKRVSSEKSSSSVPCDPFD